jgi:fatty-acyl-CoA synthase
MPVHEHGQRPYEWVGALSQKRAQLSPDKVGVIDADRDRKYTYRELDERANRTAKLLREYDIGAGDRVAAISRNCIELIDLYFATAKVGAILAPLSHRLSVREMTGMLNDVDPALLVAEEPFWDAVESVLDHDDREFSDSLVLAIQSPGDGESTAADHGWETYSKAVPEDGPVETTDLALSDPHLFLHTGGSTGLPKEVVQTHGSIAWNAFNTITSWGLRPDDTTPMVFPLFHTGGWNVLTIPLFHVGGTVIIWRDFEPGDVLDAIETYGATVLVAVPAVLRFMVEHDSWAATDLSSIRLAKSGGGPCRDSIIQRYSERGIELSQGYGLTECGPNNFAMPDDFPGQKTDSIGMPGLYVDARVVGEDGAELDQGEVGELELASPHAGNRYWENEAETAETFGDWVSTGDLARIDDDGYFHIEGRKKNMFVSGGENVYPPEIEAVITDHPDVEEAIVASVSDEKWGEVGKAVIEGNESLTLDELREFMDGKIASFKIPRYIAFVDSMPMSGPSKIDRQAIEEEFGGENTTGE